MYSNEEANKFFLEELNNKLKALADLLDSIYRYGLPAESTEAVVTRIQKEAYYRACKRENELQPWKYYKEES